MKVAFGYLATSKKSAVFRCPVSCSSSVITDPVSILTETTLCSALLFMRSIVPLNCLNDPLLVRVTFDATKSTFEFSGEMVKVSPPVLGAPDSAPALLTDALGLLAAGSEHPTISVNNRKRNNLE